MFRFAAPEMLHLLWLLPVFALGYGWIIRQEKRRLQEFTSERLAPILTSQNSRAKEIIGSSVLFLGVVCMLLGLARPQIALRHKEVKTEGLDIMLLVDSSRSMSAKDTKPTRLERARRALFYLVDNLPEHRLGLLPFAGNAFLNCPATQDTGALKLLIDSLQTDTLPLPGTDLGNAVAEAISAFQRTGARHRVVVVISDGENFGQAPFPKIVQAAKEGIRTYCLGVGTEQGEPVPAHWHAGATAPETQKAGVPRMTRLHERTLQKMALLGQGTYTRLTSGGEEEAQVVEELNKLEKIELYSARQQGWEDYYPWLALLALLLVLGELMLGRRKRGPAVRDFLKYVKRSGLTFLLLLILIPVPSQGARDLINRGVDAFEKHDLKEAVQCFDLARRESAGNAMAEYDMGCAWLAQHEYDQAYRAFTRALPYARGELLKDTWYNLGYTVFYIGIKKGQAQKWQEAIEAFKQCLLLNPQDDDARYNLELIMREIKKRTRQVSRREEQSQGQEQGKQAGRGADKPGPDRQNAQGQKREQAPPSEEQEQTSQRQSQSGKPSTSGERPGRRQKGMSQEDALRTLRSLEADEGQVQKQWHQDSKRENKYNGPAW